MNADQRRDQHDDDEPAAVRRTMSRSGSSAKIWGTPRRARQNC
jgi:hypothetical protein